MSFENFPTANIPEQKPAPQKRKFNYNAILLGVLIAALAGTWAYMIWDKSQSNKQEQQLSTQLTTTDAAKNDLQRELNEAVMNLDMMKSTNAKAEELLKSKDSEIQDLKNRIQKVINDKNATSSQLAEARRLIKQLKGNIEMYAAEIEKLKGENLQLT